MDKELIRSIIYENWQYLEDIVLTTRHADIEPNGNYIIVGARQSGKSYLLYQIMQQHMAEGIPQEAMVYINFDDERLRGMQADDLDLILKSYATISERKPMLFFDEIQNIEGWANFARRLANMKYRVFITGSNAKMLSREMETVLGGRYLALTLYPFSFREYLEAKGNPLQNGWEYGKRQSAIIRHMADYFAWGGYPELLQYAQKRNWLNGLFTRIYFNDIVVRYAIKNEAALRLVVHKLAESVKQPVAINRIANMVKSTGTNCSPSTIMDYLSFLEEAFMIFSLRNYASKFVERETSKKYYFIDNGLLHTFLTDADTSLLENICAIELKKRYGEELYFYNRNIEVDFYIPVGAMAVQACYRIADAETMKRETDAIARLNAIYPLREALIVTYEDEGALEINGLEIRIVPLWKWILQNNI